MQSVDVVASEIYLRRTLEGDLGWKILDLTVIQYDADCPFQYNNYLFEIRFEASPRDDSGVHEGQSAKPSAPGCCPIPPGIAKAIGRVSNPGAGLNEPNRIKNEVAAMMLAREALKNDSLAHLIPQIYHWSSATLDKQGWILMEFKPGVQLAELMPSLTDAELQKLASQIAIVFASLHHFHIPRTVERYGGLSLSDSGDIINGSMTTLSVLPEQSFVGFTKARILSQLQRASRYGIFEGKNGSKGQKGLEHLLQSKLASLIGPWEADCERTLVHGDFSATNILVDPHNLGLTALLDFDFAYVGSRLDEFCSFMPELYGRLPGPIEADMDSSLQVIRQCILRNEWDFPSSQPDDITRRKWKLARIWHTALVAAGVGSPGVTARSSNFSSVNEISESLCPFIVCNDVVASSRSKEAREADLEKAQEKLILALRSLGCV